MQSEKLIELLLAYLSEREDKTTEISKLTNAEWKALLRLSTHHGVAPLLYHRLSNAGVPDEVFEGLYKAYHSNVFRNIQYYHSLSEVLKRLQGGGIDVIVLKGAYLAKTVYQSQALRAMGDIDLLVKKADLGQAEKILLEMGYGPTERPSIKAQCVAPHLVAFTKKDAFRVEIHWTLFTQPLKIMVDTLWEQTRPFTVAGIQVLSLSPENLLFHLCIHTAVQNGFFGIRFLCDIHNTIRYYQDEIDWEILFHRARQWKAEKAVYLALYVARDCLAASVPEKVLEQFKPDDFNLERVAKTKEIITKDTHPRMINDIATLWKPNKSFREKLSIVLKRIFLPPEMLVKIYHAPENSLRVYFYYPVRLKDLLVRHSGKVWRMLRGDKEMQALMTQENRVSTLMEWMKSN